jgi:hypothetical protein
MARTKDMTDDKAIKVLTAAARLQAHRWREEAAGMYVDPHPGGARAQRRDMLLVAVAEVDKALAHFYGGAD